MIRRLATALSRQAREIHPATLSILVLLAVFALMLALSEPLSYQAAPQEGTPVIDHATATASQPATLETAQTLPTATPESTPTITPLPEEFLTNREQTIGIVIGTVVLVLIVIGGSLVGIWSRRRE